ncbi:OLC1v1006279C1 [Oldenlandia corymbosa var. corymbosa]|uniref:RING-type E3 ubiquitin transferase n=1 Tax=Oldenlandia corymbosa var. corymbosa TaxID=529605 RepID=A0AAV1DGN9_OLDCO|nr:OLC1v1006279C1 [Oldenlandia corymbosa var. corymbosa]
MASSEESALKSTRSQWYVTDLSISLEFHNHNLAIVSVVVFAFVVLVVLLFFHFIRQYRELSSGHRSHELRVGGIAVSGRVPNRNKGLDEATINSLPTFVHTPESGGGGAVIKESSECSICLGVFEENEKIKVIPKCMHVYHLECLDKWLCSHGNCPLCRSTIDSSPTDQLPA